jgi:hypothetical protein
MNATQDCHVTTFDHASIFTAPAAPRDAEPVEFARAMEDYKNRHNRPFPTWSEVLEVVRSLGYTRRADLATTGRHKVRINRVGLAARPIRAILARFGGVRLPSSTEEKYGFPSLPDRDRALDAVRADQGWTSVEPQ